MLLWCQWSGAMEYCEHTTGTPSWDDTSSERERCDGSLFQIFPADDLRTFVRTFHPRMEKRSELPEALFPPRYASTFLKCQTQDQYLPGEWFQSCNGLSDKETRNPTSPVTSVQLLFGLDRFAIDIEIRTSIHPKCTLTRICRTECKDSRIGDISADCVLKRYSFSLYDPRGRLGRRNSRYKRVCPLEELRSEMPTPIRLWTRQTDGLLEGRECAKFGEPKTRNHGGIAHARRRGPRASTSFLRNFLVALSGEEGWFSLPRPKNKWNLIGSIEKDCNSVGILAAGICESNHNIFFHGCKFFASWSTWTLTQRKTTRDAHLLLSTPLTALRAAPIAVLQQITQAVRPASGHRDPRLERSWQKLQSRVDSKVRG